MFDTNFSEQLQFFVPRAVDLRRRLHACPEIGFDLPQTRRLINDALLEIGIVPSCVGKGSLMGEIGPKEGDVLLLRADCDGLAGREETDLPFRAENGNRHACGHDLHAAILLGTAAYLKQRETDLSRPVRFLFQGAEETLEGAADAVAAGVCNGVTEAYMLHVTVGSGFPAGTVILPPGGITAPSADFFELEVQGKGCHGADPALGVDPLAAAARILLALEHLPAREIPSGEQAVLTVGVLEGGCSHNVIPDKVFLKGTMRCYHEDLRKTLHGRICAVAKGIDMAHGVKTRVSFPFGCPSLWNDPSLRDRASPLLSAALGENFFSVPGEGGRGTAGSEDFAAISRAVPSLMLALSAGDGGGHPLHHPAVCFDEACIPYGMAAFSCLALQ